MWMAAHASPDTHSTKAHEVHAELQFLPALARLVGCRCGYRDTACQPSPFVVERLGRKLRGRPRTAVGAGGIGQQLVSGPCLLVTEQTLQLFFGVVVGVLEGVEQPVEAVVSVHIGRL